MNLEKIGIILNEFGIHSVEDFSKVKKGFISHNYKVQTDKGVFFLKQVAKEKVWQIDSIESIEGFFAKNGIPVIEPIKTKDGQLHFIYNEECYVLYPFCTGIEYKRAHMPHEALRNMGKSLADIHLLTKDGIKGEYKEFKYYTFEEREKRLQELDDCLSKAKAAFSHINQKSVDFVLCDKKYISPKLAIELDDKSHEREYRIERDIEVERILAESQLPLLRIKNNGSFDPKEILQRINELVK